MSCSDITGVLQVVFAGVSILVDVGLVFLAARINSRSQKRHYDSVIKGINTQNNVDIVVNDANLEHNIDKAKVQKIIKKLSKKGSFSAMNFIKAFDEIFSESETVELLYDNRNNGINWQGLLSSDTKISIDKNKEGDLIENISTRKS